VSAQGSKGCGENRFQKKSDNNVFFRLISALMADPDVTPMLFTETPAIVLLLRLRQTAALMLWIPFLQNAPRPALGKERLELRVRHHLKSLKKVSVNDNVLFLC